MGCVSSKTETNVAVRRCKARKRHIKRALTHRHAFAAAYALYTKSLKSTGAAVRQFADVDCSKDSTSASLAPPQVLHTVSNLRPPPPPQNTSVRRTPLPRAHSLPLNALKGFGASPLKASFAIPPQVHYEEEEEDDEEEDSDEGSEFPSQQHKSTRSESYFGLPDNILDPEDSTFDADDFKLKSRVAETVSDLQDEADHEEIKRQLPTLIEPKFVESRLGIDSEMKMQSKAATNRESRKTDKELGTILRLLDDLFLQSYEAGREVCQLLEAHRTFEHAPYVNERSGIKEHNKEVSIRLTWTSEKFNDSPINLASTLDRLHAWEKKLYNEVKAAEATKLELDRRCAQLKSQKERKEANSVIERTKALVKSLETRCLVEFEAVDAAISEVKHLRDDCLFTRLMNLLEVLSKTWAIMLNCHKQQVPLLEELKDVEPTLTVKETNDLCKKIIEDLKREVTSWRESLEQMVFHENECIMALRDWLHLSAEQIESDAVEDPPPSNVVNIPLYDLCREWADALNRLSAERALQSLRRFSATLHEMGKKQADEMKQKKRKEELMRELEKQKKVFEAIENKQKGKAGVKDGAQGLEELPRDPVQERRALVSLLEKSCDEEKERHAKLCEENVAQIIQTLKDGLPDVIHNMMDYSEICADEYGALHDLAKSSLDQHIGSS